MFAAAQTMSRLEQLYILIEQTADLEDLKLVIESYKDIRHIRDIVRIHLGEMKTARLGEKSGPSQGKSKGKT